MPTSRSTAANSASTASGLLASHAKARAPVASHNAASFSTLRAASATRKPWRVNNLASEALRPWPAPTMRAISGCGASISSTPLSELSARRQLLHRPAVAIGIAEEHERAPREFLHVADLDASLDEMSASLLDVRYHKLQAAYRSRRGIGDAFAHGNRAGRARRRQLHEAEIVID